MRPDFNLATRLARRSGDEHGQMLIEIMVAVLVLAVILSMTVVIVSTMERTSTTDLQHGQTSEQVQQATASVEAYVKGIVTTAGAASASNGLVSLEPQGGQQPACWGKGNPGPSSDAFQSSNMASDVAIVTAHDFDIVFCGYPPVPKSSTTSTQVPHTYEVKMVVSSAAQNRGTVEVCDYGTGYNPGGVAYSATGCMTGGSVVANVPNVWCDSYCQAAVNVSGTPPSYTPHFACLDTAGQTASSCAGATPPLFSFFAGTSGEATGTGLSTSSLGYSTENIPTQTCPASNTSAPPGPTPLDLVGVDYCSNDFAEIQDLSDIQLVVLTMREVASNASAVITSSTPMTQVNDQVALPNNAPGSQGFQPYGIANPVLADNPIAFWPLNDTSGPVVDVVTDPQQIGAGYDASTYGIANHVSPTGDFRCIQGPGSASMNGADEAPNMAPCFNGSSSYMSVDGQCKSDGASAGCSTDALGNTWPPSSSPASTHFTVGAWFYFTGYTGNPRVVASDHTDCTNKGFQLEVDSGGGSGFFDVGNGTAISGCDPTPNPVPTARWVNPVPLNQWVFYAGTYDGQTISAYLDGQLVGQETCGSATFTCNQPVTPPGSGCASCYVSIGYNPSYGGDFVDGYMADIALYGQTLNASQIEAQFEAVGTITPASGSVQACGSFDNSVVSNDSGELYAFYPLQESNGASIAASTAVNVNGTYRGNPTLGVSPGPLESSGCTTQDTAMSLSANWQQYVSTPSAVSFSSTPTFTEEAWFKTSASNGGTIVSFADGNGTSCQTADSNGDNCASGYDKHLYVGNDGYLHFGVWTGAQTFATSNGTVNNGAWHFAVATISSAGMHLYLDGQQVGSNANTSAQAATNGYWRVGEAAGGGWNWMSGTLDPFNGQLADVAIIDGAALTSGQVQAEWNAAHMASSSATVPQSTCYTASVTSSKPSVFYPLADTAGTSISGSSYVLDTSGNGDTGLIGGSPSFGNTPGPAKCAPSSSVVDFNGSTAIWSSQTFANPETFTEEAWIDTTCTACGILSFQVTQNSSPSEWDRGLWIDNSGELRFGIWDGQTECLPLAASSPAITVNDGKWHFVVATFSALGMELYVDGNLVASGPLFNSDAASGYSGYWTVGYFNNGWPTQQGDCGTNNSQTYFTGYMADVAIYGGTALSGSDIEAQYLAAETP
jgi:hypothetical protein